jgi:hypothetical protein
MSLSYLHLHPGDPPPPLKGGPFRAVIVSEVEVVEDWRKQIAKWLVKDGCLYAVTWGVECEAWHDAVDWAVLEEFEFGDIPDDRFVMTTWHAKEPLSEALWFAGQCAFHPDVELDKTLLLQISDEPRRTEMLDTYAVSQVADDE